MIHPQPTQSFILGTDSKCQLPQTVIETLAENVALSWYSADGKIVEATEPFLALFGQDRASLLGRDQQVLAEDPLAAAQSYRTLWERLRKGDRETRDVCRVGANGQPVWTRSTFTAVRDEVGRMDSILEIAIDITAQTKHTVTLQSAVDAIHRSQAVIQFDLKGMILDANENFLRAMGYDREEILGKHHRIFCSKEYAASEEYAAFWDSLRTGKYQGGEYCRLAKGGREVWIQATYNPLFDATGKLVGVIKFATDITRTKLTSAEASGKVAAIERAQAVIEFDLTGKVLEANDNFLRTFGYTKDEVRGRHHRMFCEDAFARSAEYSAMWDRLRAGEFERGEFRRLRKDGKDVWISASYNPIFDLNGRVLKIVKFATNITGNRRRMDAIGRVQAVLEMSTDGSVRTANDNFLNLFGYHIDDIRNRNHRMFCGDTFASTAEYREFWDRLTRGEFFGGRVLRFSKSQKRIWLQANYNPVFDDEGSIIGVTMFAADITRQVELEESVEQMALEINRKSQDISSRSNTVARGAQSLGATTEEMTASIEELTASIQSITQNVKNSSFLAQSAQGEAEKGAELVNQAIDAMNAISKSSEDINDIVKVMGEIAAQTNLLAFNAAIEAARAGEHGWGFSVVADEVRKLAERSSQAARDITKLIQESLKRIQMGSETSKSAGQAFSRIVTGVEQTTRSILEISSSTEEQLIAAREVSASIQNVARETELAAEASETIAVATRELTAGSDALAQLVAAGANAKAR